MESKFPGFRELVEYKEVSTPLSYELGGRSNGEFYGIPAVPQRFKLKWLCHTTPIKNFYLTGTDASSLGFIGAMMGGVVTASAILEPAGFPKILRAVRK